MSDAKGIYSKLQSVALELQNTKIKKSGKNAFAKFDYYELKDFLPKINELLASNGIWHKVDFVETETGMRATLTFIDENNQVTVSHDIPKNMTMKGMNEMQVIGSIQTYARRYLYLSAFGITDGEVIDAQDKNQFVKEEKKVDTKQEFIEVQLLLQKVEMSKRQQVIDLLGKNNIDISNDAISQKDIAVAKATIMKVLKKQEEQKKEEVSKNETAINLFEGE